MIGPLHCDISQQNRLLLNMVDLKIEMTLKKPSFCLMADKVGGIKPDYKVLLQHASLFIRKVKISPGVSVGHVRALEQCNANHTIDRVLYKTYSILSGSWSFMQDNVFVGPMPNRVIIGLLKNSIIGQYDLNPFLFNHHNVNF